MWLPVIYSHCTSVIVLKYSGILFCQVMQYIQKLFLLWLHGMAFVTELYWWRQPCWICYSIKPKLTRIFQFLLDCDALSNSSLSSALFPVFVNQEHWSWVLAHNSTWLCYSMPTGHACLFLAKQQLDEHIFLAFMWRPSTAFENSICYKLKFILYGFFLKYGGAFSDHSCLAIEGDLSLPLQRGGLVQEWELQRLIQCRL